MTLIDRRAFITMLGGSILAAPLAAGAQPTRTPRVGILFNASPTTVTLQLEAYRRGLRELGWIEGQTVMIEYRWAEGNPDRLPALVAELVQVKVDVIVLSGTAAIRAARRATSTIPIVFVMLADPIASGFVQSLARPGGNMTGLASQFEELITKQLQLLKEAVPNLSLVALLQHTALPGAVLTAAETAARSLGLTTRTLKVAEVAELENAFKAAQSERVGAIQVLPSPVF